MALQDNPLTNLHPEYQKIYTDLLSRLTQAQSDLSTNVLRKDKADITPYNLSVAASADLSNAVTKQELMSGLFRPFRNFKSVSTTDTHATIRTGQIEAIMPVLGGQYYSITSIRIKVITAASLATTITIKNGTTTVFTTTVALINIPVVGKVIDILGLASTLPADIPLPATLTVTASSGIFDILLDGVLL